MSRTIVKLTKTTKITLLITSVVVLFGIFCFILVVSVRYMMGDTSERRLLWRQRSKDVIGSVESGFSREQVINIAKEHGFLENWIYRRDSEILISTPGEFGASNWVIKFGFSNNNLKYIKVRTSDNFDSENSPKGAPKDIIYSTNTSE